MEEEGLRTGAVQAGEEKAHINTCRERMKNRETDFSVVPNDCKRGNEHKPKHVKFHWNSRINFFFFSW